MKLSQWFRWGTFAVAAFLSVGSARAFAEESNSNVPGADQIESNFQPPHGEAINQGQTLVGGSSRYVPEGHVGYVVLRPRWFDSMVCEGGYTGCIAGPTTKSFRFWYGMSIIPIDIRPMTYTEPFIVLGKDRLRITFNANAIIRIADGEEKTIREIVERYSADKWYVTNVKEVFRSYVRQAVQGYDSTALNERETRNKIEEDVKKRLESLFKTKPFVVESVTVGDIGFPRSVAQAVELTQKTQQDLERKKIELDVAKKEAEIQVVTAQGKADAQRAMQTSLTPLLVQYQAVEALKEMAKSPNKTIVYIPVGANGVPLVTPVDVTNSVMVEKGDGKK